MKVAFIRVAQVTGLEAHSSDDSLSISIKIIPSGRGSSSKMLNLNCSTTWSIIIDDILSSSISIVIFGKESIEIARVTLPLKWFSINTVTTSSFPMLTQPDRTRSSSITLDIHISDNGQCPFIAPNSNLLVKLSSKQ